jgi:hypothetical protein
MGAVAEGSTRRRFAPWPSSGLGAARTEALRQAIEDTAGWMAEVAACPVDPDVAPGILRGAHAVNLHELGAVDAARAIRRRELSPVDLVDALLGRIDAVGGQVQAWALVDRDGARAEARRAADEAARGVLRGPLHGVPFGAKGIFYSAALRPRVSHSAFSS